MTKLRTLGLRNRSVANPDHDRVLGTKTWSCTKMTWFSLPGHRSVPGFEN